MLKRAILITIAALIALFGSAPAFAAEPGSVVVSINPSEQEIDLRPGDHKTSIVTVYNVGQEKFEFDVEAVPYRVKNNKYEADFVTENAHTRLSNWITFPESHFLLEPDRAISVEFNIDVPVDALGGGQYAAIIIRADSAGGSNSAIKVIPQLASLIYGHIRGAEMNEDGEMTEHKFPSFILGDNFRLSSTFANYGNVDFRVTETLTIRNFFTSEEVFSPTAVSDKGYNIGTVSATVLPETARSLDQTWPGAPQLGIFRVKQTINFLDEELVFEQVVFVCPLWLIVLVGAFVLLLVIWIISRIANRRRNSSPVL